MLTPTEGSVWGFDTAKGGEGGETVSSAGGGRGGTLGELSGGARGPQNLEQVLSLLAFLRNMSLEKVAI
jgi:hypothetical protein